MFSSVSVGRWGDVCGWAERRGAEPKRAWRERGLSFTTDGTPCHEHRRDTVATKRLLERTVPGHLWASYWPWLCHPSSEQLPRRPAHGQCELRGRPSGGFGYGGGCLEYISQMAIEPYEGRNQ